MKLRLLKSRVLEIKRRNHVALLLLAYLTLVVLTQGATQLRNQKRVTALQLGEASEGSRVTIISDGALSDYEAYRRGDRFYVKIPLAELSAAVPHFRADGFEDLQVQRVADGLLISFKLQPGASARVDQRSNRLDVIFSSPTRSSRPDTNVASAAAAEQARQERGRYAAGPVPGGSGLYYRDDTAATVTDANRGRASRSASSQLNSRSDIGRSTARGDGNSSTGVGKDTAVKKPVPFPTPMLTPATSSGFPPLTIATQTPTPLSRTNSTSSPNASRGLGVFGWMATNRFATLLGALILLSLAWYVATALRGRRQSTEKPARVKPRSKRKILRVPPKFPSEQDQSETVKAAPVRPAAPVSSSHAAEEFVDEYAPGSVASELAKPNPAAVVSSSDYVARVSSLLGERDLASRDENGDSTVTTTAYPWVQLTPLIGKSKADADESTSDEEDREVFEL